MRLLLHNSVIENIGNSVYIQWKKPDVLRHVNRSKTIVKRRNSEVFDAD